MAYISKLVQDFIKPPVVSREKKASANWGFVEQIRLGQLHAMALSTMLSYPISTIIHCYYNTFILLLLYTLCHLSFIYLFKTLMLCLPLPSFAPSPPLATLDPKPLTTHTWLHIKYAFSVGLSVALIMQTPIRWYYSERDAQHQRWGTARR